MPSTRYTRRRLVATGGALATAALGGCSQLRASDAETTPERRLVLSLSPLDGTLRERYVVDLAETPAPWDERAFDAALNDTDYTTQYRTPFLAREEETPTYARRNGTYYHLDSEIVGEETLTHPVLRLSRAGRLDDVESPPAYTAASALPEADRRAVRVAYFAARARGNVGGVPQGLVQRDGYVYRSEDAVAASALLDDDAPTHVAYRDVLYEVAVEEETFHEARYRPDVDAVADSESEMEAILRAAVLDARVSASALSADARGVLQEATADQYAESHPYSDAYESVLRALGHWVYLDGNVTKDAGVDAGPQRRYLRYDGRYFAYTLRFVDA